MKCRNSEKREKLLNLYDLKQISHVKLLPGQQKISCTGNPVEDTYFLFGYKSKSDGNDSGTFLCGSGAGRHFLELLNEKALPLFNPLSNTGGETVGGDEKSTASGRQWNTIAKQLTYALDLIVVLHDVAPKQGAITTIRSKLEQFFWLEPFDTQIKGVNTIIGKFLGDLTLQEKLSSMRKDGVAIREFNFFDVNEKLESFGVESNFG